MKKKEKDNLVVHATKKPISRIKKIVLFLTAQILLAASVLTGLGAYNQCVYRIDSVTYGDYDFTTDIFEKKTEFEDSNVFNELFRNAFSEIAYLSVIKNQFEDKGLFNGKKKIDITDYAYRRDDAGKANITATYELDDLLKWGKSGVEFTPYYVSLYNYGIPAEQIQIWNIPEYAYLTNEKGFYDAKTWMLQPLNYYTDYVEIFDITEGGDGNYYGYTNILNNKYRTTEGANIDGLVNNWSDYFYLVHNLTTTINNLETNYYYYQILNPYYFDTNTNVMYCVSMEKNGKTVLHTNVDGLDKMTPSEINNYFHNNCVKYLSYSPDDLEIDTNTNVTDTFISEYISDKELDYVYNDNSHFWVGIDKNYSADDEFLRARDRYSNQSMDAVSYILFAGIFAIGFIMTMFYLCYKTGWKKDKDGNICLELTGIDEIPTEIFICLLAILLLFVGFVTVFLYFGSYDVVFNIEQATGSYFFVLLAICVFLVACLVGAFVLSFVRRIKAGTFFKNSLIVLLCRKIAKTYEEGCGTRKGVLGISFAYLSYLCVNFVAVLIFFLALDNNEDFFGILVALIIVCIDFAIGFYHIRCRNERFDIIEGIDKIKNGETSFKLQSNLMHGANATLAEATNHIGDGIRIAVETSMKDEKMKADLITNVSHDIKTPLTSIINYVDLLKRENIKDEKIVSYIKVLDEKSQRLKQLTIDLVEASKISSGNVTYELTRINIGELVNQAIGEFEEKFKERDLSVVAELDCDKPIVMADGRHIWRVIENLFNNVSKYALQGTRIYIKLETSEIAKQEYTLMSIKNISAQPLNINADELTERFIRGDVSRSSEGSGLGLSIAKSLTEGQNGKFNIYLDGDLFKATIAIPCAE